MGGSGNQGWAGPPPGRSGDLVWAGPPFGWGLGIWTGPPLGGFWGPGMGGASPWWVWGPGLGGASPWGVLGTRAGRGLPLGGSGDQGWAGPPLGWALGNRGGRGLPWEGCGDPGWAGPHLASGDLHHGVQTALGGVQVSGNELLPHLGLELVGVVGELQHVPEGERRLALLFFVGARVLQLLGVRVHEGEHRLVHEGPEA